MIRIPAATPICPERCFLGLLDTAGLLSGSFVLGEVDFFGLCFLTSAYISPVIGPTISITYMVIGISGN